ncbi:MAG: archaellin/type IV pilin N-terminal domain-containing protein [Candidatus Nanohalobium sp.]
MLDYNLTDSEKGITPVIATVLLLGITVAIGLTVYTQAQGMISGSANTDKINKVQNTELKLSPVYKNTTTGEIVVRVTNTGGRAINTSKFSMYFGPPNYPNPIARSSLPSTWKVGSSNGCMTGSGTILSQGENIECNTGVKFPGALQTVEIQVRANNFEYSTSAMCTVQKENAKSC